MPAKPQFIRDYRLKLDSQWLLAALSCQLFIYVVYADIDAYLVYVILYLHSLFWIAYTLYTKPSYRLRQLAGSLGLKAIPSNELTVLSPATLLQPHGIFPQGPIYRDLSIEPHFYCFEAKVTDSSSPHTVLLFHAASVNLEDINLLYGWTRVNYFGWTIFHRPTAAITSTELEYIFTDLHRLRLNPPLH